MPYTFDELARAAGVNRHVLRNWTKIGALPPPTFRGMKTRYDEEQLRYALAIKRLRATGMKLTVIRDRLAKASSAEIDEMAGIARYAAPAPAPARAPASAPAPALGPWRETAAFPREIWERVVLCPGVVLSVRIDADAEARRVAREIEDAYALRPGR